jgi:hypothetical protein
MATAMFELKRPGAESIGFATASGGDQHGAGTVNE